eukprot:3533378-Pyramimonas_sp.AAC.1
MRCESLVRQAKKAKVAALGGELQRPVDTLIIRMQLAMRGNVPQLLAAMRYVLEERLTIMHGGQPDEAESQHSKHVFDTYLPVRPSADRFRRQLVEGLWNGNLRRTDRVEHLCAGCCASRPQ